VAELAEAGQELMIAAAIRRPPSGQIWKKYFHYFVWVFTRSPAGAKPFALAIFSPTERRDPDAV
jgi:hypothetical protein